jgi:8-oxo-dGTP diphosphatase
MKGLSTGVGGKTEFAEDILCSCRREVFEETGYMPDTLCLKGVLKTLLDNGASSWILFVYTADYAETAVPQCNEGELEWVSFNELESHNLIGFIRAIMPYVLNDASFFEGTVVHDNDGNILSQTIRDRGK